MAVRNFWVEANIDGRKTTLKGGPARKDAGMYITVYQRDTGGIETAVRIDCRAIGETLITSVWCDDKLVAKCKSNR